MREPHLYPDADRYSPEPTDRIWTIPNLISFLRILTIPVIAVLVGQRHLLAALILLAVSAASDGVDGYVARRFDQVTLLGQMLDPVADRALIFFSTIALAIAGILPWWIIAFVTAREAIMLVEVLLLARHGYGPIPVHFAGKTGTALLMMTIPLLIVGDMGQDLAFRLIHYAGLALAVWGVGMYWTAAFIYMGQGARLMWPERMDPDHATTTTAGTIHDDGERPAMPLATDGDGHMAATDDDIVLAGGTR